MGLFSAVRAGISFHWTFFVRCGVPFFAITCALQYRFLIYFVLRPQGPSCIFYCIYCHCSGFIFCDATVWMAWLITVRDSGYCLGSLQLCPQVCILFLPNNFAFPINKMAIAYYHKINVVIILAVLLFALNVDMFLAIDSSSFPINKMATLNSGLGLRSRRDTQVWLYIAVRQNAAHAPMRRPLYDEKHRVSDADVTANCPAPYCAGVCCFVSVF